MGALGAMQDFPLRIMRLMDHAEREHGTREIVAARPDGTMIRTNWIDVAVGLYPAGGLNQWKDSPRVARDPGVQGFDDPRQASQVEGRELQQPGFANQAPDHVTPPELLHNRTTDTKSGGISA